MSRSNSRSGAGSRGPVIDGVLNPLLINEGFRQRTRRKKTRELRHDPVGGADGMQDFRIDIDAILEKQTAHDCPNTGIARRRIEMLREAQLLQRQLADSFDP